MANRHDLLAVSPEITYTKYLQFSLDTESTLITYICLGTNDLVRATKFYDATLAALGLLTRQWKQCSVS